MTKDFQIIKFEYQSHTLTLYQKLVYNQLVDLYVNGYCNPCYSYIRYKLLKISEKYENILTISL